LISRAISLLILDISHSREFFFFSCCICWR